MKTMALFLVLLVLVVAGMYFYTDKQDEIGQAKDDLKTTVQEKKEEAIDEAVKESKKNIGEMLKDTGEKMIENNSNDIETTEDTENKGEVENEQSA